MKTKEEIVANWLPRYTKRSLEDFGEYILLTNEIQLNLNGTKKRCDTVLYDKNLSAKLIVEYKAPHVEITQAVFDQITRYNMVLKVKYLIVSNGLSHYCCQIDYNTQSYVFLPEIPSYSQL